MRYTVASTLLLLAVDAFALIFLRPNRRMDCVALASTQSFVPTVKRLIYFFFCFNSFCSIKEWPRKERSGFMLSRLLFIVYKTCAARLTQIQFQFILCCAAVCCHLPVASSERVLLAISATVCHTFVLCIYLLSDNVPLCVGEGDRERFGFTLNKFENFRKTASCWLSATHLWAR